MPHKIREEHHELGFAQRIGYLALRTRVATRNVQGVGVSPILEQLFDVTQAIGADENDHGCLQSVVERYTSLLDDSDSHFRCQRPVQLFLSTKQAASLYGRHGLHWRGRSPFVRPLQRSLTMLTENIKNHIRDPYVTRRAAYMLLFIVLFTAIADTLLPAVMLAQFIHLIFTGRRNRQLVWLGKVLTDYTCAVLSYLTFAVEEKPFPFGEWPGSFSRSNRHPPGERPAGEE